jgi:hypothetical protein
VQLEGYLICYKFVTRKRDAGKFSFQPQILSFCSSSGNVSDMLKGWHSLDLLRIYKEDRGKPAAATKSPSTGGFESALALKTVRKLALTNFKWCTMSGL